MPIILIIVVLLAVFVAYVASKPSAFRFERSTIVNASPEKIAPLITDFHEWAKWSPFENTEVVGELKKTFSGADKGVGAIYEWEGKKTGAGRMEMTDVQPNKITIDLQFTRPFKAHNTAEFIMEPQGDSTKLTWAMSGNNNFMMKAMHTVMNMDRLLSKDFDKGLAAIKAEAEKSTT